MLDANLKNCAVFLGERIDYLRQEQTETSKTVRVFSKGLLVWSRMSGWWPCK